MADIKILTNLDLNGNEIQNAIIQNLATAPNNPKVGQTYFDTNDNIDKVWNGTEWIARNVGGALTPNVTGDTFYGWATSPNSTARVYTSLSNITPHGELNLYAIYTYTKSEEGFTEITSSNSTMQTVTTEYTGLVTVTFTYYASTPSGGVDGNTYVNGHHYCKIGNNSISANYNQSVAANTAIQFHGNYTSSTNTSCTYYTKVNYPTMVNNTYFRS